MNIKFRQKAIIKNSENKILVVHDARNKQQWDLPGGHVEFPELHEDAFRREIREELDADISSFEIFFIHTRFSEKSTNYHIVVCYETKIAPDHIQLSHEHSEFQYVSPAAILKLDTEPYLQELAKKLIS